MVNFKFLQKLFFLLVMGLSLNFVYACGDDEEDTPFTENTGENTNDNSSNGSDDMNSNDSIPPVDEEETPQDSIEDKPSGPADTLIQGHIAVDLGLSVKWAACNIGASSPHEKGDYFAWGETEPKENYSWETYKWCRGTSSTIFKYDTNKDRRTTLERSDDAAYVNWGESWRMPTMAEFTELYKNCTWTWDYLNGYGGYRIISSNGNSIFLPLTGRYHETSFYESHAGYYWSSTTNKYSSDWNSAYDLCFSSSTILYSESIFTRKQGFPIRPVCK